MQRDGQSGARRSAHQRKRRVRQQRGRIPAASRGLARQKGRRAGEKGSVRGTTPQWGARRQGAAGGGAPSLHAQEQDARHREEWLGGNRWRNHRATGSATLGSRGGAPPRRAQEHDDRDGEGRVGGNRHHGTTASGAPMTERPPCETRQGHPAGPCPSRIGTTVRRFGRATDLKNHHFNIRTPISSKWHTSYWGRVHEDTMACDCANVSR